MSSSSDNKLVDTMVRAIVSQKQDEFIIGIIGSSVAAGNDNCYYDSYPSQLERTLGPIWEAGGMKLIVQNTGAGQSPRLAIKYIALSKIYRPILI